MILLVIILTSFKSNKDADNTAQPKTPLFVCINVIKNNILYLGVQNPFELEITNNVFKNVEVTSDNGVIKSFGSRYYCITPEVPGKSTITVLVDGKKIPFQYRIKLIPNPIARIDNIEDGSIISCENIKKSLGIQTVLRDFDSEVMYEALSYILTKIDTNGIKTVIINTGAAFNEQIRSELKKCIKGDVLIFDDIKVKNSNDNIIRKIPNITYFIQ